VAGLGLDPMTDIHIVCGDDKGGPHMHAVLGGADREPEDFTDDEVAAISASGRDAYEEAFGAPPAATIVYFD
jgi:hypothetical protein